MKILKFTFVTIIFLTFNLSTIKAETNTDCSEIKASTGYALYKKIRCKMGKPVTEENQLGNKIKNILKKPFKKKSDN